MERESFLDKVQKVIELSCHKVKTARHGEIQRSERGTGRLSLMREKRGIACIRWFPEHRGACHTH